MCGIFGYFNQAGERLSRHVLQSMGQAIVHRGPDDSGVFDCDFAAVGNQRLSILDIEGGHQPFMSDDGLVAVVQNGEIFNFVELAAELRASGVHCRTKCDTEVILRLYELHGISFLHRLNGMFAIAILDLRKRKLFLARDRLGVKPLYVARFNGHVYFGSEIKSVLAAGIPRRANRAAIDAFLALNYVPLPMTAFVGIEHVMPGTYCEISQTALSGNVWWDLARIEPERRNVSEEEWAAELRAILDDATRIRLRSDVPFGAFLSGGVDSSAVVGAMAQHAPERVKTFCIGFNDPRFDESEFAAAAAQRFNTEHISERVEIDLVKLWPRVIRHCDQPHGDASFMPTLRVSELAARHVKVVLTGDGGDELFGGYEKYLDLWRRAESANATGESFEQLLGSSLTLFDSTTRRGLYEPTFLGGEAPCEPSNFVRPLASRVQDWDRINTALYFDVMQLLPGNNLVKPDRMGMAVSIEARNPFLDFRMVEFAFRMPGNMKVRGDELKYLLKRAVEPSIGHDLAFRAKRMFTVPIGEWFRGALANYCQEILLQPSAAFRGLFRSEQVERLWSAHVDGRANHTRELRALIALELWAREFEVSV